MSSEEKYNRGSDPDERSPFREPPSPLPPFDFSSEPRLRGYEEYFDEHEADPNQPPVIRKIPRIHLSTAVLLMIVSGALLWANMVSYPAKSLWDTRIAANEGIGQGWPFNYYPPNHDVMNVADVNPFAVAVNILAGMMILLAIGVISEKVIQYKKDVAEEPRKDSSA